MFLKEKKGEPFVFLASGSFYQPRKNHDLLIEAFLEAFQDREDVQLKIQARGPIGSNTFNSKANELTQKFKR